MTVDFGGNVYISDVTAGKVRKVTADGKVGMSFALEARQGESTDALVDLGVDDAGHLYAARRSGHLIRKFDPGRSAAANVRDLRAGGADGRRHSSARAAGGYGHVGGVELAAGARLEPGNEGDDAEEDAGEEVHDDADDARAVEHEEEQHAAQHPEPCYLHDEAPQVALPHASSARHVERQDGKRLMTA